MKIDRAFVIGLGSTSEDTAITSGIISLGHSMDLKVVEEGVETDDQLSALQSMGCDMAQGYLPPRPVPPAQVPGVVERCTAYNMSRRGTLTL